MPQENIKTSICFYKDLKNYKRCLPSVNPNNYRCAFWYIAAETVERPDCHNPGLVLAGMVGQHDIKKFTSNLVDRKTQFAYQVGVKELTQYMLEILNNDYIIHLSHNCPNDLVKFIKENQKKENVFVDEIIDDSKERTDYYYSGQSKILPAALSNTMLTILPEAIAHFKNGSYDPNIIPSVAPIDIFVGSKQYKFQL